MGLREDDGGPVPHGSNRTVGHPFWVGSMSGGLPYMDRERVSVSLGTFVPYPI